jgi:hypothetical protein
MKLTVFTKGDGPEIREAIETANRIAEEGFTVEFIDLDEDEGGQTVEIYDIYTTPAFAVSQDDGKLVEIWRGETPTDSEIKNFLRA